MKKRPNKKPKMIKVGTNLMSCWDKFSPEDLLGIAETMKNEKILYLSVESADMITEFYEERMETELEAEVRYAKELKAWEKDKDIREKQKVNQIERLKKEAKKLGLTIQE